MADFVTGTLIRLRLTIWRRTPNAMRGLGIGLGVAIAIATLATAAGDLGGRASSGDLLLLVFAAWLVGWVVGPIQTGGADFLRPEWFGMLPIPPRRAAASSLVASGIGIGPAVTVIVLASHVVYGARLGGAALTFAVVAIPLLLIVMILASKIAAEALGGAARSRIATEIAALQYGLFIAAMIGGWGLLDFVGDAGDFSDAIPAEVTSVTRALPSGWGIVAVEAAGRGDWLGAGAAVAGLAALVPLGLMAWAALMRRRLTGSMGAAASRPRPPRARVMPASPLGAVTSKDLWTWTRDPRRGVEVRSALWAAAFTTAGLWVLVPEILPFAGVTVAIIGAMTSVNVYAMDGTALWLTLLTPGAERADVRGRQAAWLLIFAPAAVVPSALGVIVSGATWAIPWVAALVPALLGGAAGLIPLLSVYGLAPETDAHKRTGNPAETGADAAGLYFLMFFSTILTAAPAAVLLWASVARAQSSLAWAAVVVGLASGLVYTGAFGRLAYRRLESKGPELLQLMRVGRRIEVAASSTTGEPSPRGNQTAVGILTTLAMIALFPQAIVPAFMKFMDNGDPSWFLALHAPRQWQWPIVAAMAGLAVVLLGAAHSLYRRANASSRT